MLNKTHLPLNDRMKLFIANEKGYRCCFVGRTSLRVPHVTEEFVCQLRRGYFHPCFKSEGMNSFVINPLCSAHPTFLLWRLSSVSERGSKTGPDRSSYHTLRQIAHGLFGEALPPFGIPHILQSNSYQPQTAVRKHTNTCKIGNWEAGSMADISISILDTNFSSKLNN